MKDNDLKGHRSLSIVDDRGGVPESPIGDIGMLCNLWAKLLKLQVFLKLLPTHLKLLYFSKSKT